MDCPQRPNDGKVSKTGIAITERKRKGDDVPGFDASPEQPDKKCKLSIVDTSAPE